MNAFVKLTPSTVTGAATLGATASKGPLHDAVPSPL
jgi:hypothetical protein